MYKFKVCIYTIQLIKSKQLNLTKKSRNVIKTQSKVSSFCRGSMETSLALHGEVLGLDHTDGVKEPGLRHLAHSDHGVFLLVVFQNVIIRTTINIATCNYYVPVISGV